MCSSDLSYNWSTTETTNTINNLSAGNYEVTINDSNGCERSYSYEIAEADTVIAIFTANNLTIDADNGETLLLANNSMGAATYEWDFGDGNTTTFVSPWHEYAEAGTYTVTLNAFNGICTDQTSLVVTVLKTDETCNLVSSGEIMNNPVCFNENTASITLENNSGYSYTWSNGNTTNTIDNLFAGAYVVTISNNADCNQELTFNVDEVDNITADFTTNKDTVNLQAGATVLFTNNSAGASSYSWSFGDGNTSTAESPWHTYSVAGDYNVELIASNNDCNAQLQKLVVVTNTTGIAEDDMNAINIYSFDSKLYIEGVQGNSTITIFNSLGQLMETINYITGNNVYNLNTNYNSGVYMIKVSNSGSEIIKKVNFVN